MLDLIIFGQGYRLLQKQTIAITDTNTIWSKHDQLMIKEKNLEIIDFSFNSLNCKT